MNIDGQNAEATEQTAGSMADIANTVTEKTVEKQAAQAQEVPDNISEFKDFVKNNSQQTQALEEKVNKISQAHEDLVNSQHREMVNKEIDGAAEKINAAVGGDQDMARLYLETQYQKDPNLAKVWDNRGENPEALDKALELLGNEWKSKNTNLIDSEVAENQRALQASQKAGGTVQESDLTTKLSNMPDAEFSSHMYKLSRG